MYRAGKILDSWRIQGDIPMEGAPQQKKDIPESDM